MTDLSDAIDELGRTAKHIKQQRDTLRAALASLVDRDLSYIDGEVRGIMHSDIIKARAVLAAIDEQPPAPATAYLYTEEACPKHVASTTDKKVCGNCGVHVDSFR